MMLQSAAGDWLVIRAVLSVTLVVLGGGCSSVCKPDKLDSSMVTAFASWACSQMKHTDYLFMSQMQRKHTWERTSNLFLTLSFHRFKVKQLQQVSEKKQQVLLLDMCSGQWCFSQFWQKKKFRLKILMELLKRAKFRIFLVSEEGVLTKVQILLLCLFTSVRADTWHVLINVQSF